MPLAAAPQNAPQNAPLPVSEFEPKSMLHAAETRVPRSRYPVIDFHTHITGAGGLGGPGKLRWSATPEECLAVMDRKNLRAMVDVTGGYGENLREAIAKLQTAHAGRFFVFTEPAWSRTAEPGYPEAPSRSDRGGAPRRRSRPEGPEDARSLFA